MIKRTYQESNHRIDNAQSVTIEADANASSYLKSPITDRDLVDCLRNLEPSIVVACWIEVKEVDELGLYRVRYLSDSGQLSEPTDIRYSWKEVKVWVVPSSEQVNE
jgi:hypothetical protein